jgi:putative transposase
VAQGQGSAVREALQQVLGQQAVEAAARKHGVVQRERKVRVFLLVWTLVLGFSVGDVRTLEGLRQLYQRSSGDTLSRSAFYERLSAKMAKMLYQLAQDALAALPDGPRLSHGPRAAFREVLAIDATVLRLHELLQRAFRGTRTHHSPAAAKLHVVMNVADGSPKRVKLTEERGGDASVWKRVGGWVADRLLLFDLGYYCFHLWHCIDQNGGFFLTRAKSSFNPVITAVHRQWRGQSIEVVGKRLSEVLPLLQRQYLDVEVEVSYELRVYRGVRRKHRRTFRVVAVRNDDTGEYHVYITNVPTDRLSAEDVRFSYSLRWQVELLFKSLKSHGHLDQLPSSKPCVVECLIWAAVLAAIVNATLYRLVRDEVEPRRQMPPLRFAALFSRLAIDVLDLVLARNPRHHNALWQQLLREAPDPNIHRKDRAIQRVQGGAIA